MLHTIEKFIWSVAFNICIPAVFFIFFFKKTNPNIFLETWLISFLIIMKMEISKNDKTIKTKEPFRRMRRERLPQFVDTEGQGLFSAMVLFSRYPLLFSGSVSVPHQLLFDGGGWTEATYVQVTLLNFVFQAVICHQFVST